MICFYCSVLLLPVIGNLYIADHDNNRIRKVVISTSIITTCAGKSTSGDFDGDGGAATSASLNGPYGVAVDSSGTCVLFRLFLIYSCFIVPTLSKGNVYIADAANNRVRKVTAATSIITTIAGSGGTASYSGDGSAATSATLNTPTGVVVDTSGK